MSYVNQIVYNVLSNRLYSSPLSQSRELPVLFFPVLSFMEVSPLAIY